MRKNYPEWTAFKDIDSKTPYIFIGNYLQVKKTKQKQTDISVKVPLFFTALSS